MSNNCHCIVFDKWTDVLEKLGFYGYYNINSYKKHILSGEMFGCYLMLN